jgi:prepilin-type N-terminal cleavage/methylation domain-containing protein
MIRKNNGFTLIEIIASLTIVGIIASAVGTGLVTFIDAYSIGKENSSIAQKVQIAMNHIVSELREASDISGSASSITYKIYFEDDTDRTISLNENNSIVINHEGTDYTLLDNVNSLNISYTNSDDGAALSAIDFQFSITRSDDSGVTHDFSIRANPRSNGQLNGPPEPI